jgi:hypothetical protein
LWSLPFGTYGGPAGDERACVELWHEYYAMFSSPGVVDVGCIDRDSTLAAVGWESSELATHVVDISRGFDHLWQEQFDKPRRRRVRRAVEAGVTVRRGNGVDDMAAFMHVYRERLQDWKSGSGHPETLFFSLLANGGEQVRLYVAEHGGTVVGGHLNFYYKDAVIAWYGMTSTQAGDTQAGTPVLQRMREVRSRISHLQPGCELGKIVDRIQGVLEARIRTVCRAAAAGRPRRRAVASRFRMSSGAAIRRQFSLAVATAVSTVLTLAQMKIRVAPSAPRIVCIAARSLASHLDSRCQRIPQALVLTRARGAASVCHSRQRDRRAGDTRRRRDAGRDGGDANVFSARFRAEMSTPLVWFAVTTFRGGAQARAVRGSTGCGGSVRR